MADVKVKKNYKRIAILASCYFVVLLLVGVLIFSFSVFSIAKVDESQEGIICRTVIDDRLDNLDIHKGDLIISQKEFNHSQIQVGDVITFIYYNSDGETPIVTAEVTHIIQEPKSTVSVNCYKVTGQKEYVHPNDVVAVYVIGGETVGKHYANIGSALDFMRSAWGYVVFVVLPAVLAIGLVAITLVYDYFYLKNKTALESDEESTQQPTLEEVDA